MFHRGSQDPLLKSFLLRKPSQPLGDILVVPRVRACPEAEDESLSGAPVIYSREALPAGVNTCVLFSLTLWETKALFLTQRLIHATSQHRSNISYTQIYLVLPLTREVAEAQRS